MANSNTNPDPSLAAQRAALKKLAQVEASRMTGVPVARIASGKPVVGKATSKKKGKK